MDTQPNKPEDNANDATDKPVAPTEVQAPEETKPSQAPYGPNSPLPKQKKSHKTMLFSLIIIVVVIVVAGVVAYMYAKNSKDTSSTTDNSAPVATHYDSPSALVTDAKTNITGQILSATTISGLGGTTADGFSTYSLPAYQVSGMKFKNVPSEGSGTGYVGDSSVASANYTKFVDFFNKNHFTKVTSQDGKTGPLSADNEVTFTSYSEYGSDDMLCAIYNVDATATSLKTHIASIGCATKDSYKKAADVLQPFYAAYTKNNATLTNLVFGDPQGGNGKDSYKYAVLYQEDPAQVETSDDRAYFNGLYYQAPGSGEWTFFTGVGTGSVINCTELNTDILKKAFTGINCYDTAAKKTIQVS